MCQLAKLKDFKLIVAGSRDFDDAFQLQTEVTHFVEQLGDEYAVSIVSGMARGADRLAWEFARENQVICHEFPADWDKYGKAAGHIRNSEMAKFADGLIAFWDGESGGTKNMIETMRNLNKPVEIILY